MKTTRIAWCTGVLALALSVSIAKAQEVAFPLPSKEWPSPVMDTQPFAYLLFDRFEYRAQAGKNLAMWDVQGWVGGDYNKFWLKTEGEREMGGTIERAELQALYARRVSPYWYLQAGVREDAKPTPSRTTGVLALQGLAPYWFNVEAMAFFRAGEVSGRVEAEHDLMLSQRFVLQPRIETVFASSSDPQRGVGHGVNHVELGLRLRYEVKREFAPYIGINWTRRFGETADIARMQGRDVGQFAIVAGLRLWY